MSTYDAARMLDEWLASKPSEDNVSIISKPRRYQHDETLHDAQYAIEPARLSVGMGLINAVREAGGLVDGPALEIGCGTGLLSMGLIAEDAFDRLLITDGSPVFINILREKLRKSGISERRTRFGILLAEEIDLLPAGVFSLIALRSTLHHVLDVDAFIAHASAALQPGGSLVFQEPCMEGYVIMGAMGQFLPLVVESAGKTLTEKQRNDCQLFVDTMKFYARRDVDKSAAEDKHLFRVDELMTLGRKNGLTVEFHSNRIFEHFADPEERRKDPDPMPKFFRNYLKYCMAFDDELVGLFENHFQKYCQFFEEISGGGHGTHMHGVFVCRKDDRLAA